MGTILVGLHAFLGEAGAIAFLWVLIEMLNPTPTRLKRAKTVAVVGTVLLFMSWFSGGAHYAGDYGAIVKPVIKESSVDWGHKIITEIKEHVFLFLPVLSLLSTITLFRHGDAMAKNPRLRKASLAIFASVVMIGLLMAFLGFIISTSYRVALSGGVA